MPLTIEPRLEPFELSSLNGPSSTSIFSDIAELTGIELKEL